MSAFFSYKLLIFIIKMKPGDSQKEGKKINFKMHEHKIDFNFRLIDYNILRLRISWKLSVQS